MTNMTGSNGSGPRPGSTPFTIENIPYGVISTLRNPEKRCATAFKDDAVDLKVLEEAGLFQGIKGFEHNVFAKGDLNTFASLSRSSQKAVRTKLVHFLSDEDDSPLANAFIPLSDVQNHYPMTTYNFSDFYCSLEHSANCTEAMGKNAIDANWFMAPMVYNGRTSSLVISGTPVTRPCGVTQLDAKVPPSFTPSKILDFELEMGVFLSKPVPRGQRLHIRDAKEHIFGLVLLNDWSARDIQKYEMPPLGPFHSKGFATTISPWIVTIDALELVQSARTVPQDPAPLPHLDWKEALSATFSVSLSLSLIRDERTFQLTDTNLNELYWTPYQQLTHLGSAGEGLSTGDILGTGTISSARRDVKGEKIGLACIFERVLEKNKLSSIKDLTDTFLLDGDEVVIEGWCCSQVTGQYFGFGQCRGIIVPALAGEV